MSSAVPVDVEAANVTAAGTWHAITTPKGEGPQENALGSTFEAKDLLICSAELEFKYVHQRVLIIPSVSTAAPSSSVRPKPRYHVQAGDESYSIYGVDAIWHNQYLGPESDFRCFRKQYDCDINELILLVAEHVDQGLYFVISMNATPHCLTVICGCEKMRKAMPEDMFDDPSPYEGGRCNI